MKCPQSMRVLMGVAFAASPLVATAQQLSPNQSTDRQAQARNQTQVGNQAQAGNQTPGGNRAPAQARVGQQPTPQVVATVDGEPITRREVQASLQPQLRGQQVNPQQAQQLQQQILQSLIQSRLVEQYVRENGPEIQPQEVEKSVAQLKQQLQTQQVAFNEFLASRGYTEEMLRNRIKGSLAWQKFQQAQVTEPKLKAYYQENQQRFQAEDFAQARDQVAQAYIGKLWKEIVAKAEPQAEIKAGGAARPNARRPARPGQAGARSRQPGQQQPGQPQSGQPQSSQ